MKVASYKDLIVWQKAIDLVDLIYDCTAAFPQSQKFSLADQMQRAAISIPSNIAEGSRRTTAPGQLQFFSIAFGSGSELETQLVIAARRSFADKALIEQSQQLLDEILRMLCKLIQRHQK